MTTSKERAEAAETESAPKGRRSRAKPVETPPAEPVPADETPPAGEPETVAVHTSSHTCVFCNHELQVDLDNMGGGRFISEPALGIKHYICAGCGDA